MKFTHAIFSGFVLCLHAAAQESGKPQADSQAPASKAAVTKRIARLEDCPEAVRAAVKRDGHADDISDIQLVESGGKKTYAFETGTEDDGVDQEVTYHYSAEGTLVKTEKEISLKAAPEVVQKALLKLAGKTAVVDDVEMVTEGAEVHYKAELESNGGADRKVTVSATGETLENIEESDD